MLVLSLPAFENKKYTAYDRFHGNGLYGEIPTKKEPIRALGFTLPYNNDSYCIIAALSTKCFALYLLTVGDREGKKKVTTGRLISSGELARGKNFCELK